MTIPFGCFLLLIRAVSLLPLWAGLNNQHVEIPFRLCQHHMIVVETRTREGEALNLMIDTGAELSVLRSGIADRLHLPEMPANVAVLSYGRKAETRMVRLSGLKIGPLLVNLPFLEVELSDLPEIDGFLGLDLLRRYESVQIDYQEEKIRLGAPSVLPSSVPVEETSPLVIVPVQMGKRSLHLILNTGSEFIVIHSPAAQVPADSPEKEKAEIRISHASGESPATWTHFEQIRIGPDSWRKIRGILLVGGRYPNNYDGVLGVVSLGMRRVQVDFQRRILSWSR